MTMHELVHIDYRSEEEAACTSENSLLVAAQEVPDSHRAVVGAGGKFTICWRETGQDETGLINSSNRSIINCHSRLITFHLGLTSSLLTETKAKNPQVMLSCCQTEAKFENIF